MNEEIKWSDYESKIPLSNKIIDKLFPNATPTQKLNKSGVVIRILLNHKKRVQ